MKVDLDGDERVVARTRPHPGALLPAAWAALAIMAVLGFCLGLLSRLPALDEPWSQIPAFLTPALWVAAAIAALAWVVGPVLRWWRREIVITTRRVLVQQGRRRRQLPLAHILSVTARPGLGRAEDAAGTLILQSPRGTARIAHVPSVRRAARIVRELQASLPWWEFPPQAPSTRGAGAGW